MNCLLRLKPLPIRWVYKVKLTETCDLDRYKARLVAKGYKQVYGVSYIEVYALSVSTPLFGIY